MVAPSATARDARAHSASSAARSAWPPPDRSEQHRQRLGAELAGCAIASICASSSFVRIGDCSSS